MAKFFKYTSYTLLGLVVLTAIGIGILISTISPNALKGPIIKQVESLTGRKLTIAGNISWSFFPWLGVNVHNIQLANARNFGDEHFASLKEANVQLRLLPLLRSKIEIGDVTLQGLKVNLTKNAAGKTNWEDLLDLHTAKADKINDVVKANHKTTRYTLAPLALTISSVNINDSTINFNDHRNKHKYTIENLHLQSKNLGLNHDFPIALNFKFNSANLHNPKTDVSGRIMLNTTLELDQQQQSIHVSSAAVTAKLQGIGMPKNGTQIDIQTSLSLHLKTARLHIISISGKIANMQFAGDVVGNDIFTQPSFTGDLSINEFNPKLFATEFGIHFPKFRDNNALQKLGIKTHYIADSNSISLSQLKVAFDNSNLTGTAKIAFLDKSEFNLALDQINLNNYMTSNSPSNVTKGVAATSSPVQANSNAEIIPTDFLRKLNLSGNLAVNKISINKINADRLQIGLNAEKGIIKITPMTAFLYHGTYSAAMTLDVRGSEPKLALLENINNMQVEPLMNALTPEKKSALTGTIAINSNVNTRGATAPALTRNLNGKVNFALNNGVLKGIDLDHQLEIASSLLNKMPSSDLKGANQTTFKNLTGSFHIKNGIASNNDLFLQSTRLQATGSGVIDLVNQSINYNVKISALENAVDPKITNLQNMLGGSVPIKITGTFTDFKIYPDAAAIAKAAASAYVKKATGKIKEHVQAQVGKEVGQLGGQLQQQLKSLLQ